MASETNTLPVLKALRLANDAASIVRHRKSLVKELLKQPNLIPTRVAILGGSTTAEVKNMLELFLLGHGVQSSFYESGYNRFSKTSCSRIPISGVSSPTSFSFTPRGATYRNFRN